MLSHRPKLWTAAVAAALAGVAGCGDKDVLKEEPTPIPATAAAPVAPQPSTTTYGAPAPVVEDGEPRSPDARGPAGEPGPG